MPEYCVNATVTFGAYYYTEADSPEEALESAKQLRASEWDYDTGSGSVDFDTTPMVE